MKTVSSKDGTTIAFDEQGDGPALVLVDGAMGTRSSGSKPELARLLAQHFTVYSYDRRGRGDRLEAPIVAQQGPEHVDASAGEGYQCLSWFVALGALARIEPESRRRIGRALRERVAERHSVESWADGLLRVLMK